MRIHLLVLAVCCIAAAYTAAVPVQLVEVSGSKAVEATTATAEATAVPTTAKPDARKARQQAAAAEDDDDDDDDDDDLDLDVVDDDDDDDDDSPGAADDDDDDDDYFGGLFDDILGDDDDDDEEDETPAAVQPVVSPAEAIVPEEAVADEEYDSATDAGVEQSLDSELVEKDPASQAIGVELPANAVVVQPVPADEEGDEDDDDDDDDDEDELDELTSDDDDDDDDDEDVAADDDDDDDDDDDEDDLEALADAGDVIEARRSRGLELERDRTAAIYVSKYNRFVDNIIGRVNRILRRSYDPVRVKLNSSATTKKTKPKRKKNPRPVTKSGDGAKPGVSPHKSATAERIRNTNKSGTAHKTIQTRKSISAGNVDTNSVKIKETPRAAAGAHQRKGQPQRKRVKKNNNKNKKKKGSGKSAQKARATLYGLSSIKREGDVSVNMMADHTTVKTNFALGPLTLRVEKEFGRGQRREIKSATATTAEMRGKLSLRVTNQGNASLHSIKVLQPKQVRVDSPDEHDRTREFIWRRSSHIAHLVSQKLAAATRSMLKPSAKSFANASSTAATGAATATTTPVPAKA